MSKIEVKGDGNQVYHKVKKSRINSNEQTTNNYSTVKWVAIASLIVAVVGLVLRYWSSIVQVFK
jgi:hypothetical protein